MSLPDEYALDLALLHAIEGGLPLVPRPYAAIGAPLGLSEQAVMERLAMLGEAGTIKRLGVVVRHRELGYRANAMVVWDVPDGQVGEVGPCLARFPFVTLSYRRPRHPPLWPYNLFTMIHGRDRAEVLDQVEHIIASCQMQHIRHAVLFSGRRFKQRGARYSGRPHKEPA